MVDATPWSHQPRWPAGTPTGPKGPGAGRWRDSHGTPDLPAIGTHVRVPGGITGVVTGHVFDPDLGHIVRVKDDNSRNTYNVRHDLVQPAHDGGDWADRVSDRIARASTPSQIPTFHTDLRPSEEQVAALRVGVDAHRVGQPTGYQTYKAAHERFVQELGGGDDAEVLAERLSTEARIERAYDWYARAHGLDPEQFKKDAAEQMRQMWAGKPIVVRTHSRGLEKILEDGRFRTQHEDGVFGMGWHDPGEKAFLEQVVWGYGPDTDPKVRPVYGYVDMAPGYADQHLEMYGDVRVVLKPSVRRRTTAMFGDTLTHRWSGMPSPIDHPSWQSWGFDSASDDENLHELDRLDPDKPHMYAEAQIHGGVTTADIDHVVLPYEPDLMLQAKLRRRRIRWVVQR